MIEYENFTTTFLLKKKLEQADASGLRFTILQLVVFSLQIANDKCFQIGI